MVSVYFLQQLYFYFSLDIFFFPNKVEINVKTGANNNPIRSPPIKLVALSSALDDFNMKYKIINTTITIK